MWADTSALDIQNWADSEPNNVGTELCVEMFHETGQWNDASCDPYGIEKGYICKAPKSTFHLFKYIYSSLQVGQNLKSHFSSTRN